MFAPTAPSRAQLLSLLTSPAFTGTLTAPTLRLASNDAAGSPDVAITQQLGGAGGLQGAVQIAPVDPAGTAFLQIIPGPNVDPAAIATELLLYNKIGNDYQRLCVAAVNGGYTIDSTANGASAALGIQFAMGGSVGNGITGQTCLIIHTDASVDLIGSHDYTAGGGTHWAATATRIADIANTGSSVLLIDTRTGTPALDVTDSSVIEFRRGGSRKWATGLNANGGNVDSFDWLVPGGLAALSLDKLGGLTVRGDSINNNPQLVLVNTAGSGHTWRVGEMNQLGMLSFRDITAAGAPMMLNLDGTNKLLDLSVTDGIGLKFGTGTGTKIGTGATQKLGFYGTAPIAQPSGTSAPASDLATVIALANDLRTKILALGLAAA